MSQVTQAFREHHRELANQLSKYVAQIVQDKADADPQGFAAFLKNELLPHATGEESALYPRMDEIIRAHGKPTATMTVLSDISTAPTAGWSTMPYGASTPAASGMATML